MSAVNLSRKLVLEEQQLGADGAGGLIGNWVTLGVCWADVSARTGRQRDGGDISLATVSYRVVVRSAPHGAPSRPRSGQRFREGVRVFVIAAVAELGADGRYLTCFATEEIIS